MNDFLGYHSEWNLGSPGGWDYQRITQIIGKAVWEALHRIRPFSVELDFDHPLLYPVNGFVAMLTSVLRRREGNNPGTIAVVAEEETLADVTENINLAAHLNALDGISGVLAAPQWLTCRNGRVCFEGKPVSIIFMDFNTDVLLDLHRRYGLDPLLQAVREGRVINPRGTEPINVKSMYEVITGPYQKRFQAQTVNRTPWTRRFFDRRTTGPDGGEIADLIEWTRDHWENLVLKPERGYSGKGVRVGGIHPDGDDAVALALAHGSYIVQEKIPLALWAEDFPELMKNEVALVRYQTDFRCLMGPEGMFGFLGRYGGVPTNVGSGGGVQPLAVLRSNMSVREAVASINETIMGMPACDVASVIAKQRQMALDHAFTYLLGPIKIALRPRLVTDRQLKNLETYGAAVWHDCRVLENMWVAGELDPVINMEPEELEIARSNPWQGSPAIIASDGLFSFGAHSEKS